MVDDDNKNPEAGTGRLLSPEHLVEDFGRRARVARECVETLCRALGASKAPEVGEAFARWQSLTASSYGRPTVRTVSAVERLAAWLKIPAGQFHPLAPLFALQTYYALVVQTLAARILAALDDGREDGVRHLAGSFDDEGFRWYAAAGNPAVERAVGQVRGWLDDYEVARFLHETADHRDLLKPLYEDLFPGPLRHALGEYYTPDWLAEHVLDEAGYQGQPGARVLDPACGSGTFLVAAIRRARRGPAVAGSEDRCKLCQEILHNVVGFDLNPLAVLSARTNYLIALGELARHVGQAGIPVYGRDSILDPYPATGPATGPFDYVVGNPPWIAWDDLPDDYRTATKPLWEHYGLFTLSARDARHGGAKKDLSMLMVYRAADQYLADGGRLAMVLTQTLFQTRGAGDGFRRFRLGNEGPALRVVCVDDLVALRPFATAANWTSTLVLEKGCPTVYPVPYVRWSPGKVPKKTVYDAQPVDPQRPTSPWFLQPRGLTGDFLERTGPSDYRAHLGANTGGANGIFWLRLLAAAEGGVRVRNLAEGGRRSGRLEEVEAVLEPGLLYPLLRWGDVARYCARPSAHLLLVQDPQTRQGIEEETLRRTHPRTYAYLEQFESRLRSRAAYRRYQQHGPFYSMYDVDRYTLTPIKVVWRRMDRRIRAAVVGPCDDPILGLRPVVPQETCVLVACDCLIEAHYLCAVMNSAVVGFLVQSHSVRGGKGFGTPGMLDVLRLRRFDPSDSRHQELAVLSRQAHEAVLCGEDVETLQEQIDRLAGLLWELSPGDLALIRSGGTL